MKFDRKIRWIFLYCVGSIVLFFTLQWALSAQWQMAESSRREATGPCSDSLRVVPVPASELMSPQGETTSRFLVVIRSKEPRSGIQPIILANFPTQSIICESESGQESIDIVANQWVLYYVSMTFRWEDLFQNNTKNGDVRIPKISFGLPWDSMASSVTIPVQAGVDLLTKTWESYYQIDRKETPTETCIDSNSLCANDDMWRPIQLPKIWEEIGITWLRCRFEIPEGYGQTDWSVSIPAIDDADTTYFNGQKIGNTAGWDTPRYYRISASLIQPGMQNELLIAVNNSNYGGGIQNAPIYFSPVLPQTEEQTITPSLTLFPKEPLQRESDRRVNRTMGNPLPLRPMAVRDGVLEYEDGGEVALWGTNYYPQSWQQYRSLISLGIDPKQAIDTDILDLVPDGPDGKPLDALDPRRINAIRIHVFDTEISDSDGNLVTNVHLDTLDYLIAKCTERGIYLWLTPIAWWGSPNEFPGAFSHDISIEGMTHAPQSLAVQQNYLRQFLTHANPYTERRIADEPCLVLFEIINEPHYYRYEQIAKNAPPEKEAIRERWRTIIREGWENSLPGPEWQTAASWEFYQYRTVREYIDTMTQTFREVGCRQPIAWHAAEWSTSEPINWSLADSQADGLTFCFYSGLTQTPIADEKPQTTRLFDVGFPSQLSDKFRLVYEFDASDTLKQIDLYPAIARYFRELGAQVACQFQYDSQYTVPFNQDWPTHYLNAVHTPERFVSYLIGGEMFRKLPRGTEMESFSGSDLLFPPGAVSWEHNSALLVTEDLYMQARPTTWQPYRLPELPKRIIAVGSTPYYDYDGTGTVDLRVSNDNITAVVSPNVTHLRDGLCGSFDAPLTEISPANSSIYIKVPKWRKLPSQQVNSAWEHSKIERR